MDLLANVVSGVASGVLATGVLTAVAALWRWRLLRKYGLTNESREVLETLWDEQLLRRSAQIAAELDLSEATVLASLEQLQKMKLARERNRSNDRFWKITFRGKEYLRVRSWIE